MPSLERALLEGLLLRLEPLEERHIPLLAVSLTVSHEGDRSSFGWTPVPTPETVSVFVARQIAEAATGVRSPYAQVERASGRVLGLTSYITPYWVGERLQTVEVGSTFLIPEAQGTGLNTEAKLLLFTQAFEGWGVDRVQICTDERNGRSRAAIAAVGGVFEGILRGYRTSAVVGEEGQPRNTAMYAITAADWPSVKERLESRLASRLPA